MRESRYNSVPESFLEDFSEQDKVRKFLWQAINNNRLSSTYLFTGPSGIGKFSMALKLTQFLKCQHKKDGSPCGQCNTCRTIINWSNPDILIIFPMPQKVWDSDKRFNVYEEFRANPLSRPQFTQISKIRLQQINEIQKFLFTLATTAGGKFVLIADAHNMNIQSSNSFLKTLEEPPKDSHLILTTDHPESLLPTIRSRVQEVKFKRLPSDEIYRKLVLNHNIPEEIAEDLAKVADGSLAMGLMLSQEKYVNIREETLKLVSAAADGNLDFLWNWATEAQANSEYSSVLFIFILSVLRDAITIKFNEKLILNKWAETEIAKIAHGFGDVDKIMSIFREVLILYRNTMRNPQYSILYGALVASLMGY